MYKYLCHDTKPTNDMSMKKSFTILANSIVIMLYTGECGAIA